MKVRLYAINYTDVILGIHKYTVCCSRLLISTEMLMKLQLDDKQT